MLRYKIQCSCHLHGRRGARCTCEDKERFLPYEVAEGSPCLEYIKHIVLPWFGYFEVPYKEENGGGISRAFWKVDYESGALDPVKVKLALTKALNRIMNTVRGHFTDNSKARDLKEAMQVYYIHQPTLFA